MATANQREAIIAELPRLRRYARALLKDADAADDLVQDCIERALSRLHQFRSGSDMRAWLFSIMRGIYINGARRGKPVIDLNPTDPQAGDLAPTPPEQGAGLVVRDLEAALARLSVDQREIVLLIGLENLTYKQASEVIGVPIGTVMSRLARGREQLRLLMDEGSNEVLRRAK